MSQSSRSTFGKYVLLRKLASGGMGEVFLAKQRGPSGFEKLLVIKRILSHHLDKRDYLDMFFSEAKLVARLNHNNIIQIQEMGEIDGDYYIAMEYVRGKSLRDVIDELRAEGKTLPLQHVIDLAIKLCEGLGYAHQARDIRGRPMNIVHRDINPHNVLISYNGDLKLIDFGIAKSEMTSVHTATGTIKGKFVYMSPEQSAADPIDRRSDIFSLGIVLYEMTVLENPFVRQNVVLSLEAIQRHAIPPPSSKRKDAQPLDAILAKALEKRPEDRYQTAIEMRDDLRALFRSGVVEPAEEDVSAYLHELFRADIDEEDRLLAEADRATTPPGAKSDEHLPAHEAPRLTPYPDYASHSSDEEAAAPALPAHAFGDEEPTLSADYESMARRSRAISSSGRGVDAHEDPFPMPKLPVIEDDAPPEIPTRSDRIPGRGAPRSPSDAHATGSPSGAHAARSPSGAHAARSPSGALATGSPSGAHATRPPSGAHATRPPSGAHALLGGVSSISPLQQGRPSVPEPTTPPAGLDRPIMRPAAFDEPISGPLLGDAELDPSLSGHVFAPFPSRTPLDRPFDRDFLPRRGPSVVREESGDLIGFAPLPPWRRAGYWAAGVVLFLATTMMGYAITRAVVPDAPRTDIDRIPPTSPAGVGERRTTHLAPTPDPADASKFVGPPLSARPEPPADRDGIEPIPGVTLRPDAKRFEPAAPSRPKGEAGGLVPSRPKGGAGGSPQGSGDAARIELSEGADRAWARAPSPGAEDRAGASSPGAEDRAGAPSPGAEDRAWASSPGVEDRARAPNRAHGERAEERAPREPVERGSASGAEPVERGSAPGSESAELGVASGAAPAGDAPQRGPSGGAGSLGTAELGAGGTEPGDAHEGPRDAVKTADGASRRPVLPVSQGEAKAAAATALGAFKLNTSSEVSVVADGRVLGPSVSRLTVKRPSGKIVLSGVGSEFAVTLEYRIEEAGVALKVDATPSMSAKHNGVSLGWTPQNVEPAARHRFSLLLPGADEPLLVALDWTPVED